MSGILLFTGAYSPPFDEGVKLVARHLVEEWAALGPETVVTTAADAPSGVTVVPGKSWQVLGRLRRIRRLVAAMRPEAKALPVHFYLAGDGPEQAAIKTLADQLGVKDKVTFGGFRRDLPTLYKGADVFLLCSRYESLPLSIREGMVASLPVIATDVGGIAEAVEDGASGILLPHEDSEALAKAIVRLATDAALRERLGRRGHEIYLEKFDYDHWIVRTVEVMTARRTEYIEKMS